MLNRSSNVALAYNGIVITSRDYLAQSQIRSRNSSFLIFLGRDLKIILFENK